MNEAILKGVMAMTKDTNRMYAYCRVSTQKQDLQRQLDNIGKEYPQIETTAYYCDKYTGKTLDRPAWNKLYKIVKQGDTIVFDSVSRMSRDAVEGFATYKELYDRGVTLVFLNEPYCNTDTYRQSAEQSIQMTGNEIADCYIEATNKVLMILAQKQIATAFEQAEKERQDISKRVKDGMRAAKLKAEAEGEEKNYGAKEGVKLTTKKSIEAKEIIKKHCKDFGGSLNDADCAKLAGISRNSYYKYKRELIMSGECAFFRSK